MIGGWAQAQTGHEPTTAAHGAAPAAAHGTEHAGEEKLDMKEVIFGHVLDDHYWHLFSVGDFHASLPLPCVIVDENGLHLFSSSKFHHGHEAYEIDGVSYSLSGGQIVRNDNLGFTDLIGAGKKGFVSLSMTKNVISLILSFFIMLAIFLTIAKRYKNPNQAPKGLQNALEPFIIFIRDEVAKPMLGDKWMKWLPYLLTLFFFIWVNNILGLLPGGANLTGNITLTFTLALLTLIFTLYSSNKHYWGHIFNPPGIPTPIKFILAPVELLSVITKPFALMIRLFANMLAGHMIILCLIGLIFIFGELAAWLGYMVSPLSVAFSLFIFLIETLVAFIQAFIFTLLTAMFIGEATPEPHHEDHH